jgi:predicted site-specific integrase-resolvase
MPGSLIRNPRRVSLRQAAAHIGINEDTMRRLVQEGIVPAYRVSQTRIIVDLDEAEAALRLIPKNMSREANTG